MSQGMVETREAMRVAMRDGELTPRDFAKALNVYCALMQPTDPVTFAEIGDLLDTSVKMEKLRNGG